MTPESSSASWRRVLVLGGARSGKSGFAERLASECGGQVLYVATATAGDAEMAERIARHQAQRPRAWRTIEAPSGLAAVLHGELIGATGAPATILVEDLTLLLANLMAGEVRAAQAEAHAVADVEAVLDLPAHVVLVSNEVGMGIVPPYPLGRRFRDSLGRLNQRALASEAYLLVAGIPLRLK